MSITKQNGLTMLATAGAGYATMHPQATNYRQLSALNKELHGVNGRINQTIEKITSSGRTAEVEVDVVKRAAQSSTFQETTHNGRFFQNIFSRSANQGSSETYMRLEDSGIKTLEGEVTHLQGARTRIETQITEARGRSFLISPVAAGIALTAGAMHVKLAIDAGTAGNTMSAVTHAAAAGGNALIAFGSCLGHDGGLGCGKAGMALAIGAGIASLVIDGSQS